MRGEVVLAVDSFDIVGGVYLAVAGVCFLILLFPRRRPRYNVSVTRPTRNSNLTRLDELGHGFFVSRHHGRRRVYLLGSFGQHDEARTHLLDPRRLHEDRLPAVCGYGPRFVIDNWREERGADAILDLPELCVRCRQIILRLETSSGSRHRN